MDLSCILPLIVEYLGDPVPLILVCSDWYYTLDKWGMNTLANLIDTSTAISVRYLLLRSIRLQRLETFRLIHLIPNITLRSDGNPDIDSTYIYRYIPREWIHIVLARESCHQRYVLHGIISTALSESWSEFYHLLNWDNIIPVMCIGTLNGRDIRESYSFLNENGYHPGFFFYHIYGTYKYKYQHPDNISYVDFYNVAKIFDIRLIVR